MFAISVPYYNLSVLSAVKKVSEGAGLLRHNYNKQKVPHIFYESDNINIGRLQIRYQRFRFRKKCCLFMEIFQCN